ncbi:MAG: hypothetical protein LH702_36675, partial [Phormidesmis sp. CAN_BIN44]|nr:hypothetical protein [Phormidesmis sp. CAN_BIN44]
LQLDDSPYPRTLLKETPEYFYSLHNWDAPEDFLLFFHVSRLHRLEIAIDDAGRARGAGGEQKGEQGEPIVFHGESLRMTSSMVGS